MEQPNNDEQAPAATRKQINVRLSPVALDLLERIKSFYGLSTTALFEFLVRQEGRHVAAEPVQPTALPSPADDEDEDELDGQRFSQQVARQNRIDQQRNESR